MSLTDAETAVTNARFVRRWDDRPRHPRGASPYVRLPERETYTESEEWERPDGTTYTRSRSVSRWAGSFSFGDWR